MSAELKAGAMVRCEEFATNHTERGRIAQKYAEHILCVTKLWSEKIADRLKNCWVMFRMQTEFEVNGHCTIAYFAKLKPD